MKTKGGIVRIIILAIILAATVILEILHLYGNSSYPSAHAVCPLGGLENLWTWFAGQSNLQKLFSGTMTLFFFTLVFALIFGRSFCGNLCPFGGLFEFVGKLTKKKFMLPPAVDKPLRYLKYVILVLITYMAWKTATLWISPYDPYAAFAHVWKGAEVFNEYFIGFLILVACLLLSLVYERFFCKYLCPAGALYGVVSKISPLKIKRNPCINCRKCSMKCPMNIDVAKCDTVNSAECIACGICVNVCPNPAKYIGFSFFRKSTKPLTIVLITAIVFFGSLLVFDGLGLYQVSIPTIQQVEQEGTFLKIGDLRGSMSIEIGAQYTGKSLEDFYAIMEIPKNVAKETLLKNINQQVPDYDFHVMKAKKASE
jgi:polyferredoxin